MFSLTDELSKFQKLAYDNNLDEIITIDDKLLGSGITFKDLVSQNHFIITQLRKMKEVFINYCKLNDKIYKKIIDHQLSVGSMSSKLTSMTSAMDRKIDQSLKIIKVMNQNTQIQNRKAQQLIGTNIQPIKVQLDKKVDVQRLGPIIKTAIQQYDNGSSQKRSVNGDQLSPLRKKRKNASSEQLELFKNQLINIFEETQKKIKINQDQIIKLQSRLNGCVSSTSKANNDIQWARQDIRKIRQQLDQSITNTYTIENNLMKQIIYRTNDNVWQKKLNTFKQQHVSKQFQQIKNKLKNVINNTEDKFSQLPSQFGKINFLIEQINKQIKMLKNNDQNKQENLKQHSIKIQQLNVQLLKSQENLQKIIISNKQIIDKQIDTIKKNMDNQIKRINHQLINSANQIQSKVYKGVKLKFKSQLKQIQNNIKIQKNKIDIINSRVVSNANNIQYLKDIVSKKANFTDLLMVSDNKANREDIIELKDKISSTEHRRQTTQNFHSKGKSSKKSFNNSVNLSKFLHNSTQKNNAEDNKLFMCGFQEIQIKDTKQHKVTNNKVIKKILRPTTAYTVGVF